MYNRLAMDHFLKPRNVGELAGAPSGQAVNDDCGDTVTVTLTITDTTISGIRFISKGCAGAIAACSAMTELANGSSVAAARALDEDAVDKHLGGLPAAKRGCETMAVTGLRRALDAAGA